MGKPMAVLRGVGGVLDRLTDNRIFDLVTGNWFDTPIDNYLDRGNTTKGPRRRTYLDADGNVVEPPAAE